MRTWFRRFRDPILARLWQVLHRPATAADRKRPARKRPGLEWLEDRLAPASLTDAFGTVTLFLDSPNETLTLSATAPHAYSLTDSSNALFNAGLTGATYSGSSSSGTLTLTSDNAISIVDTSPGNINNTTNTSPPGAAVIFANSGANSYQDAISVDLSNPLAGGISFTGTSTFASSATFETAHGSISSATGSLISVTNSDDLSMQTPSSINLAGAVNATGSTTLEAGGSITANDSANAFDSGLTLVGPNFGSAASATVAATGALDIAQASITGNLSVTDAGALEIDQLNVGGNLTATGSDSSGGDGITQGFESWTVGGSTSLTATAGSITLDNPNAFTGPVSASVDAGNAGGTDGIILGNDLLNGGLMIGTITLGAGTLQIDDFANPFETFGVPAPSISEGTSGGITTSGDVLINLTANDEDVLLSTAPNSIGGTFTVDSFSFGTSGDLALRNISSTASAANISLSPPLFGFGSGNFSVNNLTLEFDSASVTINVAPNDPTQPVFAGYSSFAFSPSGNLTLSAGGGITEAAGGFTVNGNASFSSSSGDIALDDTGNAFFGDVSASVSGSNDITLGNTVSTTLGTIMMGNGALEVDDFDFTGDATIQEDPKQGGITMTGGSALFSIPNDPSLVAPGVDLSGAPNNFAPTVSITIMGDSPSNTGPTLSDFGFRNTNVGATVGQITFTNFTVQSLILEFDNASINIDTTLPIFSGFSSPGSPNALTISSGGNITETAAGVQTNGFATFTGTGNASAITLTSMNNALTGAVSLNAAATDSAAVSFTNSTSITLVNCTLGTGTFTVTAETGNIGEIGAITQAPDAAGTDTATFDAVAGTVINVAASPGQMNLFTGQVVFLGASVADITIEDSNYLHNLGSFTLPSPSSALTNYSVTLDNPVAATVLATTNTSNSYSFTLRVTNDIVLPAGVTFTETGNASSLTLISEMGNLNLLGTINVTGTGAMATTDLEALNSDTVANINAANPNNQFGTSLSLTNDSFGTTTIVSAGALALGDVESPFADLSLTTKSGSISQATATSIDAGGIVSAAVSATGSDNIALVADTPADALFGTIGLELGSIVLGTGNLSIENTVGGIEETTLGNISTAAGSTGTLSFTVDSSSADVLLNGPNNLPTGVKVTITGASSGTTGSIGFTNDSPLVSSTIPPLSQVTITHFTVVNETIAFDNAPINIANPINITGTLTLTAGGPITQSGSAAISATGGSFTVLGNFGISLTNGGAGNSITGPISFFDQKADNTRTVAFTNGGSITLGSSTLGLGTFNVTALGASASIAESGNSTITQAPGAGAVTLMAGGPTIDLSGGSQNDFSGQVAFSDASLKTIGFENADRLATLPAISPAPGTLTSVTISLDNAPVVLPSFTTGTLTVTAGGNINQQAGTSLVVSGDASFSAGESGVGGPFGIQLGNAGNSFNVVTLDNFGQSAITINSTNTSGLVIDNWSLGSGPVTVTSSGPITEAGGSTGLQQVLGTNDFVAGAISLSVTGSGNPILLDNSSNLLLGPVVLNTTGNATIVNSTSLVLGNTTVGGGLSVTVNNGFLSQAAGTSFTVTGAGYFNADGITLDNPGNSINGAISLNSISPASLSVTGSAQVGPVQLAASTVIDGTLNVTASVAITQLPGLFGTPNDGVLHSMGASFTALGGSGITLANSANDFGDQAVALSTTAAGAVTLTDSNPNGLVLGTVAFGSGGLTLVAAGAVSQFNVGEGPSTNITGSGAVSIRAANAASPIAVELDSVGNDITGAGSFTLTNVGTVIIDNQGNINLAGGSVLSTTGDVSLIAGGSVTLPGPTLEVGSLFVVAHDTTVSTTNLTATDSVGLSFTGIVKFVSVSAVTLDTTKGGNVSFNGNVTDNQDLTVALPSSGMLSLSSGTWNIASHSLTINGAGVTFDIDGTFRTNGGTLTVSGTPAGGGAPSTGNVINVQQGGTFEVDGASVVSDGGSDSILTMNFGSFEFGSGTLLVNLAAPAKLTFMGQNPTDAVNLINAQLSGTGGAAPMGSTTVLTIGSQGGIVGTFSNPTDSQGDFLMGTDIVQATPSSTAPSTTPYTSVSIQPTAVSATSNVPTGNEADGDGYKVQVTGGSNLVVVKVGTGAASGLEIVVRTASAATTLTISATTNGGDGLTAVRDIVTDGGGAVTINGGKTTNVTGNITLGGPLTSLTLNNFTDGTLTAGPSSSVASTITGNDFNQDTITLGSPLGKLTVNQFGVANQPTTSTITAVSFGTITTTGSTAENLPGDFNVNLVDVGSPTTAVMAATIKGTLQGDWDLAGGVGTTKTGVTATATNDWNLGVANGPGVFNAGLLTSVSTLKLGTATMVTILASGNVVSLQATSLNDLSTSVVGVLQAGSFGTIQTTGNTAANDHGNLIANITATGNTGGSALTTFTVAGDLGTTLSSGTDSLLFENGNVGTIKVGRSIVDVSLNAVSASASGAIATIQAGAVSNSTFVAKTIGMLKVMGNLPVGLFGDFVGSSVSLTGSPGTAMTLGTFSATRDVGSESLEGGGNFFDIVSGGIGTFSAGGLLDSTTIDVESPTNGNVGTISAAEWEFSPLTARTIGTINVTGRAAAAASTQGFTGDLLESTIIAFEPISASTTTLGIGTLSVKGALTSNSHDYLLANNGIGTFTVGRNVSTYQVSTDLNSGTGTSGGTGGIGALTAGEWDNTDLAAFSLVAVSIKGYTTPEQPKGFFNGNFINSDVVLAGASGTPGLAIKSLTVADSLTNDDFNAPGGVGPVTVTGTVSDVLLALRNPLSATSGTLGNFTAGQVQDLNLSANSASTSTIKTTANAALGANGDFSGSTVAIAGFTGTAPIGLAGFTVAGNLDQSTLEIADGITTFTVARQVTGSTITAATDSMHASASIKTLTVGAWSSTTLTANSVGTFTVSGNSSLGLAGSVIDSDITLLGALAGTALGTFTATGHVLDSNFVVSSGNVTSFTTEYFTQSNLLVGYAPVDPGDFTTAVDQTGASWEGTFTLGTFKTTATLTSDVPDTAGFADSDVIAGKLTTITLSGMNPTAISDVAFGIGFRKTGGTSGTLKVTGATVGVTAAPGPGFDYFGLGG